MRLLRNDARQAQDASQPSLVQYAVQQLKLTFSSLFDRNLCDRNAAQAQQKASTAYADSWGKKSTPGSSEISNDAQAAQAREELFAAARRAVEAGFSSAERTALRLERDEYRRAKEIYNENVSQRREWQNHEGPPKMGDLMRRVENEARLRVQQLANRQAA